MKPFNFDLTGTEATPVTNTNTSASTAGSQAPAKSGVMSSMSSFFGGNKENS